jgi:hypothetical protein
MRNVAGKEIITFVNISALAVRNSKTATCFKIYLLLHILIACSHNCWAPAGKKRKDNRP